MYILYIYVCIAFVLSQCVSWRRSSCISFENLENYKLFTSPCWILSIYSIYIYIYIYLIISEQNEQSSNELRVSDVIEVPIDSPVHLTALKSYKKNHENNKLIT